MADAGPGVIGDATACAHIRGRCRPLRALDRRTGIEATTRARGEATSEEKKGKAPENTWTRLSRAGALDLPGEKSDGLAAGNRSVHPSTSRGSGSRSRNVPRSWAAASSSCTPSTTRTSGWSRRWRRLSRRERCLCRVQALPTSVPSPGSRWRFRLLLVTCRPFEEARRESGDCAGKRRVRRDRDPRAGAGVERRGDQGMRSRCLIGILDGYMNAIFTRDPKPCRRWRPTSG